MHLFLHPSFESLADLLGGDNAVSETGWDTPIMFALILSTHPAGLLYFFFPLLFPT